MMESATAVSVYEKIGGEPAVTAAVNAFYERVLADPLLQGIFQHTNLDVLKRQQVAFFTQALGGPERYRGPDMKTAHAHLAIQQEHFNRVAEHLVATLQSLGVGQAEIQAVVEAVSPLASDIVNTASPARIESTAITHSKKKQKESGMRQNGSTHKGRAATLEAPEQVLGSLEALEACMESLQANVFIADASFHIVYINQRAKETLQTIRSEIESSFDVNLDEILGGSIHRFHQDPKRIERILKNPAALPHQAQFSFSGVTLEARINGVYDRKNEIIAYVVNWEDVTEKAKIEMEMARVMSMMENAPINVMFADRDFRIQYMNPASTKTLKGIEHLLPIKVSDMLGHSIDVFHKNPLHQRKLLSDPKNLPHRATIQLGSEFLDLLVSPIYDNNKNYLGAMVTWEVITARLAQERQIQEAAEREKAHQLKLQEGVAEIAEIGSNLASASEELTAVSSEMGTAADETASQANVVAAAAEEGSKNVQSVATGSEEMTASIQEIAKNTTEAAKVASQAVSVAESTNVMVAKLGQSSAEIGSIIKVINSIAQQTNLLALNATIEAARAGEAGKGFAVVANEVKELAKETTKATENISRMIETIQGDTKGSVDAIAQITTIIKQVNDYMNTIACAVEEQTVTTNEMARNVSEASKGSMEIAGNIVSVADAAQKTTEGATQTQQAASELAKMACDLQSVVARLT